MIARNILITEATVEPLTDQEACDHIREDIANMGKVRPYLISARQAIEQELITLKMCQATYELQMDGWFTEGYGVPQAPALSPTYYGYVTFPAGPLISVTSIKYDDTSNVEQTMAASNYYLDTASMPGRIRYAGSASFPGVYNKPNCVRIRYVVGYGAAGDVDQGQSKVPAPLKTAIRFQLQRFHERGANPILDRYLAETIQNLISPYRFPI